MDRRGQITAGELGHGPVDERRRVVRLAKDGRSGEAGDARQVEIVAHPVAGGIRIIAIGNARGPTRGEGAQAIMVGAQYRQPIGQILGTAVMHRDGVRQCAPGRDIEDAIIVRIEISRSSGIVAHQEQGERAILQGARRQAGQPQSIGSGGAHRDDRIDATCARTGIALDHQHSISGIVRRGSAINLHILDVLGADCVGGELVDPRLERLSRFLRGIGRRQCRVVAIVFSSTRRQHARLVGQAGYGVRLRLARTALVPTARAKDQRAFGKPSGRHCKHQGQRQYPGEHQTIRRVAMQHGAVPLLAAAPLAPRHDAPIVPLARALSR